MGGLFSSPDPEEPKELLEDVSQPETTPIEEKKEPKVPASDDQLTLYILGKLDENTNTFQRGVLGSIFQEAISCLNNLSSKSDEAKFEKAVARLLSECARHPSQILCRGDGSYKGDPCCFSHIVSKFKNQPTRWTNECNALTRKLARQLCQKSSTDLDCQAVVKMIKQAGDETPSSEFTKAMEWLEGNLERVYNGKRDQLDKQWAKVVCDAADAYRKRHEGTRQFRPVQLAAILLYVHGFEEGEEDCPTLGQMQTGEGKTDVCAAIAAVLARLHPDAAVHIITSSNDRAADDRRSTMEFFKLFLGEDRLPGLASESLKWGKAGSGVVYAQITDIQKMVVDEIKSGIRLRDMYKWFKSSYAVIDECDHVLIEQATNQLYMSGPCPSFQELDPAIYLCQRLIDFEADFARKEVETRGAVRNKAPKLVEKASKLIGEFEKEHYGKGSDGKWPSFAPHKVDAKAALERFSSSCLSARLKRGDEEYIVQNEQESGKAKRKVTIMDQSTGTEAKQSRWTHEAPFLEAIHGLPVDGVEPLAYFNSIVVMVQKYKKFAGVTGTLGQDHCQGFYDDVYGAPTLFRFPRNRISCLFQLHPQIAERQDTWLHNIGESLDNYLKGRVATSGRYGFPNREALPVTGPVLIIVNSVAKAKVVVEHLEHKKHKIMERVESQDEQTDGDQSPGAPDSVSGWRARNGDKADRDGCHVYEYYLAEHMLPEEAPNGAIFVASNKGGRGLDIKLDGACPERCHGSSGLEGMCGKGCAVCAVSSATSAQSAAGSVLFVMITDVMSDRQDRQAVGRCGRGAKPGIFQYQILKEATTEAQDEQTFDRPLKDNMAIINDQLAKLSSEAGEMQQKRNAIHEAREANKVMDDFAYWKPKYVDQWLAKIFDEPKLSLQPQGQRAEDEKSDKSDGQGSSAPKSDTAVRKGMEDFLNAVVENRWKCWRDCGAPERDTEHGLDEFRQHQCLCDPVSLAKGRPASADPFQQFADRVTVLAELLRLDAELMLELGLALLKLGKHDSRFKSLAQGTLEVAAAANEGWKLHREKQWQAEWTGSAALLLASLATQLPSYLKRSDYQAVARSSLDNAAARIQEEIYRYQKLTGVKDKFGAVASDPDRKAKAFYVVQVEERINQLEHRKEELQKAKRLIIQGLKIKHQVQVSDEDKVRRFKFMGELWAKTVFAWGIDDHGFRLVREPVKEARDDGEWGRWLAEQESVGGGIGPHAAGGGGGGPNQQIKTDAGNFDAEKEVVSTINSVELGVTEQVSPAEVVIPKMSINYAHERHSSARTFSPQQSSVTEKVKKVATETAARVKKKAIELTGRAKRLLLTLNEQVRLAFRTRTEQKTEKEYTNALAEEYAEFSLDDVKRMEELVYRKNVQPGSKFSNQDVAGDVKHDGKGFKSQTRGKILAEADKVGSEQFHVRDTSLSEADQYLNAQALMALMQYAKQGGANAQLTEVMERLQQALAHWNARMQQRAATARTGRRRRPRRYGGCF